MNPPVYASTSITSPAKYSPLTSFDSIVDGSISFTFMPPRVIMAWPIGMAALTVIGTHFISAANACRCSRVTELVSVSAAMPESCTITGIILRGKSPSSAFWKLLRLFC